MLASVKHEAPAAVGDRITLVRMSNDPAPIPPRSEGTVTHLAHWVDGSWNIGVRWDNGRTLGLVHPEDKFIVRKQELSQA